MTALWITIIVVGLATYATRLAPFVWRGRASEGRRPMWLDLLGPCLLAAMAATVIVPAFAESRLDGELASVVTGLVTVSIAMRWRRDPGLATLLGMFVFFLGQSFLP